MTAGRVWPERGQCRGLEGVTEVMKNSIESIVCTAQRIRGDGASDLKEEDVGAVLAERAVEPTKKDLGQTAERTGVGNESQDRDDGQPKAPRIVPLTGAKTSEWNSALGRTLSDVEGRDPCLNAAPQASAGLRCIVPHSDLAKSQPDEAEAAFLADLRGSGAGTTSELPKPNS